MILFREDNTDFEQWAKELGESVVFYQATISREFKRQHFMVLIIITKYVTDGDIENDSDSPQRDFVNMCEIP